MPDIISGDIRVAKAEHPSLGPAQYEQKSTGSNTYDGGGLRATDDKNGVTNAGTIIWTMQNERGVCVLEIGLTSDIYEYTRKTAADLEVTTYNVTYRNGKSQKFSGRPVGDIVKDEQAGTMTATFHFKPIEFL